MKTKKYDAIVLSSQGEKEILAQFVNLLKTAPLPSEELLSNLGLFLTSKNLSRLLFFYEIYKKIIHVHGIIVEFGVRWGQTLSLMSALRGLFEPFNRHRKIVGFDTFKGFKGVDKKDGTRSKCVDGSFSLPSGYEDYLDKVLAKQEALNPMSHLKRYELMKGDAIKTVPAYFKKHPETIISLAVFDFDIYKPTKVALRTIMPNLCRGSILVFDELCDDIFPGETMALKETLGLKHSKIERFPMTSRISYIEIK
ncbi:MAG: TylF/MycF/NovP-related O-methyltransferase [Candidatus Omnitrophota bacterium]|nr:TylF/MycF/NovP-related O-methyltransferase [Candidatus Omnitrophota bacterium]